MSLALTHLCGFGGIDSAASAYVLSPVVFDGSTYLTRGAELSGNADGKQGTVSFWVNLTGGDAALSVLAWNVNSSVAGHFQIARSAANKWSIAGRNTSGTVILSLPSSNTYTSSSGWHHVLASWKLGTSSSGYLYINDAADLGTTVLTNDTIDYTRGNFGIGAGTSGASPITAKIADLYINLATFIDLSVAANRRLFIDGAGAPVDLGSDGATPTGTKPIVFLKGPASGFPTNKGSGGNFAVSAGSLTDASYP